MKKLYGTWFGSQSDSLLREFKSKFEDEMESLVIENDDIEEYCDNSVVTSKYNVLSFLPRALFEQFRRVANLYFLLMSILMLIGTYTSLFDSPISPWSTLGTLSIVLTISMTKEGMEDTKRHTADNATNNQTTLVLNKYSSEECHEIKWKNVKVGNIVKIMNNQEMPADIVLLVTSEASGHAYIETSNIDGETNLKMKNVCRGGSDGPMWTSADALKRSEITVQCEQPNSAIHHFSGTIFAAGREVAVDASNLLLRGSSLRNTKYVIGIVVYTGKESKLIMNSRKAPSKLSYIEKIMNTLIYIIFAAQILVSLSSLLAFSVFTDLYYKDLSYLCLNSSTSTDPLFQDSCQTTKEYSPLGYFVTFFILYNNFIPISLYVTVEVCNYFQAYFIDNDVALYCTKTNTPAVARTSNMNSDLGMVEYIFSDKTGTLTDNIMRFKRCSIAGVVYGDPPGVDGIPPGEIAPLTQALQAHRHNKSIIGAPLDAILNSIVYGNQVNGNEKSVDMIADFVLCLACCHTVIVDASGDSTEDNATSTGTITGSADITATVTTTGTAVAYQSESPDEEALVKAAATLGYTFIGRVLGKILLQKSSSGSSNSHSNNSTDSSTDSNILTYELLATIPFDSTRKRMSVVVRRPDQSIVVYCKGADNVIFDRAAYFIDNEYNIVALADNTFPKDVMLSHMNCFASDGLRTLVLAKRELSTEKYLEFSKLWRTSERVAAKERESSVAAAALNIETELVVLGATAIEDKLQADVPSTIECIHNAGIKLWVLTGDKMETAINIGYSSKLLLPEMILIKLAYNNEDQVTIRKKLSTLLSHFNKLTEDKYSLYRSLMDLQNNIYNTVFGIFQFTGSHYGSTADGDGAGVDVSMDSGVNIDEMVEHPTAGVTEDSPLISSNKDRNKPKPHLSQLSSEHLSLIVDGDTLIKVFGDASSERMFLSLAMLCRSVIACRVSPEQKRLLVKLVKKGVFPTPVTLSIGDGANDVAMIQEAQIGVGVSGKEGRQAVNSSDFAIAQFRFLKRLLLVHGRLDYRRICKVVTYCFYKNIVLTLVLFAFAFVSGHSGQSLFEDNIYSLYNIILAWPVVAFGVFDRDISDETLLKYNFLYLSGRKRLDLNISTVLLSMLQAFADAAIIFFIPYACYNAQYDVWSSDSTGGYSGGLTVFGTAVYTYLVMAMFVRCAMLTCTWTWLTHLCFWGSLVLYFAFLLAYQYWITVSYNFYGVANEMFGSSTFWLLFVVVLVTSMLMELTIQMFRKEFFPTIVDIAIEYDQAEIALKEQELKQSYVNKRSYGSTNRGVYNPLRSNSTNHSLFFPSGRNVVGDSETVDAGTLSRSRSRSQTDINSGNELSQEAQQALQFSKAINGSGDKQKFAIDWLTLKGLFTQFSPEEQEQLGLHNIESRPVPGSTYNYDHVGTSYGPGAGINYLGSAFHNVTGSVFRVPTSTTPIPATDGPESYSSSAAVSKSQTISPIGNMNENDDVC